MRYILGAVAVVLTVLFVPFMVFCIGDVVRDIKRNREERFDGRY